MPVLRVAYEDASLDAFLVFAPHKSVKTTQNIFTERAGQNRG
jgi:hypothetical protein